MSGSDGRQEEPRNWVSKLQVAKGLLDSLDDIKFIENDGLFRLPQEKKQDLNEFYLESLEVLKDYYIAIGEYMLMETGPSLSKIYINKSNGIHSELRKQLTEIHNHAVDGIDPNVILEASENYAKLINREIKIRQIGDVKY